MFEKIFKDKSFFALAYAVAITLFTIYSMYLGFSRIPYEMISFLPFVGLVLTALFACYASVFLYAYETTKSSKKLLSAMILVALSAVFPVILHQGATPENNPKMERLFNIPIGAQVTDENIKLWSEKYPSKEFVIVNKEDGVTSMHITPNSLVDADALSSIDASQIVRLNILSDKEGTIREIQWLKSPIYRGRPSWYDVSRDFISNPWLVGGTVRYWDGRFILEKGKGYGDVFLRLYAMTPSSSTPSSDKLSERLGRAKLHSMFGE
tara:strand:+ start:548 stop:1345 length:798 start_codon:yes stop_codon:yes gene_type:complete